MKTLRILLITFALGVFLPSLVTGCAPAASGVARPNPKTVDVTAMELQRYTTTIQQDATLYDALPEIRPAFLKGDPRIELDGTPVPLATLRAVRVSHVKGIRYLPGAAASDGRPIVRVATR